MLKSALRTGTAGLVTLSMALPPMAMAQGLPPDLAGLAGRPDLPRLDGVLQICALGDPVPCVLPDGAVTEAEAEAAAATESDEAVATAEALLEADTAAMASAEEPAAEATAEAEAEQPSEAEIAADLEADAAAEEQPAEEPVAEAEPVEEQPAAEAEVAAEEEQASEAEIAAELEANAAEEQPAEEPVAEAEVAEEQPEAEMTAQAETTAETELTPEEQSAQRREQLRTERRERLRAERQAELREAREAAGRDETGETVEARDDSGLSEETAEAEAELQAEAQADAGDVAAAEEGADASAEVETETVAEGDVRSSDEEFERSSTDAAAAEESRRQGLSPIETIAILGIGALAVGALLNNGDEVVATSNDRAVVRRPDGSTYVIKDDDTLLRQPGNQVETRRFSDGSTITTIARANGTKVRTVRDATGRVLRRTRILADGTEVELFDDTDNVEAVDVTTLPRDRAEEVQLSEAEDLDTVLRRELAYDVDRTFSLGQVRNIRAVRELVPIIDLDAITFDTGSAAIRASEADKLIDLGNAMRDLIEQRPGEVFLIEGHTDAVGSAASNLALSDRRAESMALALSEYFDIPPENMVIQGYGESYLKVPTLSSERDNRRVAVRRITPLLTASVN